MQPYPLLLQPQFKERIWGGTWLRETFGYPVQGEAIGECWAISAHPQGTSHVANGPLQGQSLADVWRRYPEWFHQTGEAPFPILVKLIDAADDLSVQVHPDDHWARILEGEPMGKTECWYVVDAEPGASIVYGHTAQTADELAEMVHHGQWEKLLKRIPVAKGDFFYVPAGTIHALGKGVRVLEVQQSSDTTYRLYDYDRRDKNGKPRELHLEKALQVIRVPSPEPSHQPLRKNGPVTAFPTESYFQVERWNVDRDMSVVARGPFYTVSILDGEGELHVNGLSYPFRKGDHWLIPGVLAIQRFYGTFEAVAAFVPQETPTL
ncbi:MAG: mannose-6-phosphate isomerase [Bacillaceae bacterium G1]|nr:mannose-6-phosphate isomerase [Bacillota bacterium]OJF17861.1 MAG: mannose-6-phosphate isomerase [Bacillaceae bacterium G1]